MANNQERADRFTWQDGDVVFSPGFKTKAELIKEGLYKPAPEETTKKEYSPIEKSGK